MELRRRSRGTLPFFIAGGILGLWQVIAGKNDAVVFFIGSPRSIVAVMFDDLLYESLAVDVVITLREAGLGLCIGWLLGFIVAVFLGELPQVHRALSPILTGVTAVPIIAVSPLLIMAFGTGIPLATSVAATSVFLMTVAQVHAGITDSRRRWADLAESHNAERRRFFLHVIAPGAAVWLISGARAAVSFALLGAFIGEFISAEFGLGRYILRFAALYDANRVLAGIMLISSIAIALDRLVLLMTSRLGINTPDTPYGKGMS